MNNPDALRRFGMKRMNQSTALALLAMLVLVAALPVQAAPALKTESWADTDAGFAAFAARIHATSDAICWPATASAQSSRSGAGFPT